MLQEIDSIFEKNTQSKELICFIPGNDKVENVIECWPGLPQYLYVNLKHRIAPLQLKFEYFDLHTNERVSQNDVVFCHHLDI